MCVKMILFLLSKTYAPRIRYAPRNEIKGKLSKFLSAFQMTHHYFVNVTTTHVVLVENVKSPLLVTNVFAVQVIQKNIFTISRYKVIINNYF